MFFIKKQEAVAVSIPVVREGNTYETLKPLFVFSQGEAPPHKGRRVLFGQPFAFSLAGRKEKMKKKKRTKKVVEPTAGKENKETRKIVNKYYKTAREEERTGKVKINERRALNLFEKYVSGRIKPKDQEERKLLNQLLASAIKRLAPGEEKKNLIEKFKNLPRKKPDGIVRVEGNVIEYPIATYSRKGIEGNWTVYQDENLTRKVGSPEGPLTGFNEFQFYALLMYAQWKDGELIAKNTLSQMLKDMGLTPDGDNLTYGHKGLERLGGTIITTKKFYQAPERNHIPLNIYPFFKETHIPEKGDKNREFTFIFNDCLRLNIAVQYQITTHWKRLKGLKSPLHKRAFLYFTKCWGTKNYYKEDWEQVAKKLGITNPDLYYKKKTLVNTLEALKEKKEMDRYTLGKEYLEVWHSPEKTPTGHQEAKEKEPGKKKPSRTEGYGTYKTPSSIGVSRERKLKKLQILTKSATWRR